MWNDSARIRGTICNSAYPLYPRPNNQTRVPSCFQLHAARLSDSILHQFAESYRYVNEVDGCQGMLGPNVTFGGGRRALKRED